MTKQVFADGVVLYGPVTAGQVDLTTLQTNDYNWAVREATVSDTLVAADAGKRVSMTSASATTITVNTSLFAAGDVVAVRNLGAGATTITSGTCTVSSAGSLVVNQYGGGQLVFTTASTALWFPAAGAAAPTSRIRLHTLNGYGSSSTKIPRFTTTVVNSGSDITYADSASLGSTFTINTAGMYAILFQFSTSSAENPVVGLSLNSTELTTSVVSITAADILAAESVMGISGDNAVGSVSITFYFAVNDVIRPHTAGQTTTGSARCRFAIARVN